MGAAMKTTYTATCRCKKQVTARSLESLSVRMGDHHREARHDGPPQFHIDVDDATRTAQAREVARMRKTEEVRGLLRASDVWVVRAYEDGVPLNAERTAYRKALRALLSKIAAAKDPAVVALPARPA